MTHLRQRIQEHSGYATYPTGQFRAAEFAKYVSCLINWPR